ncbi:MAG: sugar phosphate nucleotidyltransferase [Planctomycetota bacterium]
MNLRETELDERTLLPEGVTLGEAVSSRLSRPGPIAGSGLFALRNGDALLAVAEADLRRAMEDRLDPATPVTALAREELVASDLEAARDRLGANVDLPGVVVRGAHGREGGGPGVGPSLLAREVEPVRSAIVMAGGFGTRLRPLTDDLPKPLLDVGGRPLLHRILEQLRDAGVQRVAISVHYLGERIEESIGDGSGFGLEVRYLREDHPLDTGAGLVLLGESSEPFFIVNGDILTTLDFRSFGRHHVLSGRSATMATWLYANPLAYGVVETEGERILGIAEKPVYRYPINSGVYAFSECVLARVESGKSLAMVDFLLSLIADGDALGRFPIVEYWNDVGSHADYERAQREVESL